jgi:transcriptional antiterminator RfaH
LTGYRAHRLRVAPLPTSPRKRGEGKNEATPHQQEQASDTTSRWYCIHTKPNAEHTALDNLARQGYHCFLPRMRVLRLRQGRRVRVIEPMFPRYLFLQARVGVDSIAPVRSTRGVLGLVRFGERIAEVPAALIERLIHDAGTNGLIEHATGKPRSGDRVRILEGPLIGLEAIYRSDRGEDRAVILLDLLGRDQQITISTQALERVAATG